MFCQELAAQIASEVQPVLTDAGVRTLCVGIGTLETARKFCDHVPFPADILYTDPENAVYDALGLRKGVGVTFFSADTPFAILDRLQKDGAADLIAATKRWKPWLPPKSSQGLQQGGAFVFEGSTLLFQHFDPSTGAHADLNQLIQVALAKPLKDFSAE
mmetsp:Transcript_25430/g.77171  ORF Transcript_25430/g.77171 Transcript_25430/m.77171 type:complete len:159 (+) Transcript_25430:213-689(+)|eukprot:scaffold286632_cov27-Tisochrysis_lutea.AAC.2